MSIAICAPAALDLDFAAQHVVCMARTKMEKRALRKTYIRQWRKFRGLSQEKLADRLGISHSTLGRIERGLSPYNQWFLEAVADMLQCQVADLLMRDPTQPEAIWSIWEQLSPTQRVQAIAVIGAIKRTGS